MKKILLHTLPVMIVYLSLGFGYGLLMQQNGYGWIWASASSLFVFAGAAQYALVSLLVASANPISVFFLILVINARHLFYGISMYSRYQKTGRYKWYLMEGLTDETFGILNSIPEDDIENPTKFYFLVTILNHSYWVLGSTLGALIGGVFNIQVVGLEFILVALFTAIFVSMVKKKDLLVPGICGLLISLLSFFFFGDQFIIVAMIGIVLFMVFLDGRKMVEKHE